jgi:hypothetical protein
MIISVRPGKDGKFEARVDGRLLCTSRQPFLNAARTLLAEGVEPATPIIMQHSPMSTVGSSQAQSQRRTEPPIPPLGAVQGEPHR